MRRAVINFPTPVISDQIIQEFISTETGDYTPLPYGTRYSQVQHTSFQKGRDNYYLVFQGPADNSGWVVQRIWANDRTDQDSYNYAITYMSNDPEYLQVVRTYVYPRDQYGANKDPSVGPLPPLTPDPEYPDSLLVEEQMAPDAGEQLNSRYVRVTRVYQTLPGPITLTQDGDDALNCLVYTSRQLVLADDVFQLQYYPLTLALQETPQSKYVKLRIHSYLSELPPSKTEYRTGSFPFPNLLEGITLSQEEIAPTPDPFSTDSPPSSLSREEVIIQSPIRPGPTTPALFRVLTQFATSQPVPATIYAINPNDIVYRGISFQLGINSVLNDAISVSTSFTGDGRYGNLSESYSIGASTPSKSAYEAIIGTYQVVGADITRWRFSIFVTQTTSVQIL